MDTMPLPAYADLPRPDASGLPLCWGVWGMGDQLGTLNNITPDTVAAAAGLIRAGLRFNLNLPLHMPLGMIGQARHNIRRPPRQTLFKLDYAGLVVRDDKVDDFYPQSSTQWDGLTHIADPLRGFYNGAQDGDVTQREGTRNGIEHLARFGIATRAVLVDLPRHFARTGRPWHPCGSLAASADDLHDCLRQQGTPLRRGDLLLVRTGWVQAFREARDDTERAALFSGRDYSGLSGGVDMWEFLWDHRVAGVASDGVTVECWPLSEGRPSLHLAIARLGLLLGEMFDLDALAEDAQRHGQHDYFFVSSPLNLRGGVGSPANAMAIR
ncbi:cyclase family protein [Bordetella sp. H567]|uniref:cyclase family protein n=1 Tax=Bordetella sp. H567 TaxID=1697043 RepID=UPI0009F5650B|nr:cyclase family protein [Bordetella sp. H567]